MFTEPPSLHSVLCTRQCVCVSFSSLEVNYLVRLNIEREELGKEEEGSKNNIKKALQVSGKRQLL